jgi:hypothetical protein
MDSFKAATAKNLTVASQFLSTNRAHLRGSVSLNAPGGRDRSRSTIVFREGFVQILEKMIPSWSVGGHDITIQEIIFF